MDCKELKVRMLDYLGGTLRTDAAADVEIHLSTCAECASLLRELEATSNLVRSLDRVAVPAGFDHRLADRLTARRTQIRNAGFAGKLARVLREALTAGPSARRSVLRPAIAGVLFCSLAAGSVFMFTHGTGTDQPATDRAYIRALRVQHTSFAAGDPLADESALLLKERTNDMSDAL